MRHRSIALIILALAFSLTALAVTPQFWENFTQEELLKGTLTRVSLSSEGKLFLAPSYKMVFDTAQPYIFSMARDKAGNIYVGTGHDGKVFKLDSNGNGSLYFQTRELDIFALALDAADTLYVGTSPDGRVYKVTGPSQSTEFFDAEDKYIWCMLFDDAGTLYLGTGPRGIVYKVDKSGKKSTFYDSSDTHIVSLARGSNGNLLAGTSPGGMIIEITSEGKGFTLLDSPMEEIHSLSVDRFGTIYAVASSAKDATPKVSDGGAATAVPANVPLLAIQTVSSLDEKSKEAKASVSAPGGERDSAGSRSSIYAISRDGSAETVYSSRDRMVYSAIVRPDGSILASSGGKGRLLSIDTAKQVTVVTDSPEEEMTRLLADEGSVWVGGSNQGRVYRLESQRAQTGTYESDLLDAKTVSSWGKISWSVGNPSGGTIELATRTGNTEKPDKSWSDWSAPYTVPSGHQITNPKARYLQWKVEFKKGQNAGPDISPADLLERVQIPYLQQNVRPQVLGINALPYGVALQKTPALTAGTVNIIAATDGVPLNSPRERGKEKQPLPPRQVLQPGAQSFTWKAADDNEDSLEYSIFFKGEGESDWKLLESKLSDTFCTLDAASLPDGVYRLKVVASDAPSNPFDKFLIGELISNPFVIGNATPLVEIVNHRVNGKRVEIRFRSNVPTGRISSAEFSIDGGEWNLLFPTDGIADSPQEDYQFTTPELAVGEHVIGFRSSDANGNTGTAKLILKIF